jgi:uncharacterized protein involved in type VI secretion and phage assembly
MTQYYGKYRGKVENNVDSWAMPCTPYAGSQAGWFALPPVGSDVWVEFEQGDPDYPIWAGCFWSSGNVPASPVSDELKVLKTDAVTITIDDTPGAGGLKIETTAGMKIEITSSAIEINNGQGATIKLSGPKVSINDSALEVT